MIEKGHTRKVCLQLTLANVCGQRNYGDNKQVFVVKRITDNFHINVILCTSFFETLRRYVTAKLGNYDRAKNNVSLYFGQYGVRKSHKRQWSIQKEKYLFGCDVLPPLHLLTMTPTPKVRVAFVLLHFE